VCVCVCVCVFRTYISAAVPGLDSARTAAAEFVNHAYGLPDRVHANNVIITAGGIQACHLAFGLVLDGPDDVVLATVPAYPLYQLEATYFGATFAPLVTANGVAPTPRALSRAFEEHRKAGRQVRAVVLCAPNNPTGAVLTKDAARALAAVLEDEMQKELAARSTARGFIILLDEVYLGIEAQEHVSLLQVASEALARRICLVLSASKGLGAMPGARAAWVTCMDPSLVLEMAKIASCTTGNASTIAQAGLEAGLRHCMSDPRVLEDVRDYYALRTQRIVDGLNGVARKHGLGAPLASVPAATFCTSFARGGFERALSPKRSYLITSAA
jgi:aspartate/methionine/tyrosine aminotransferase